jgi:DNA-binding transcriptional ArsR family regulator
VSRRADEPPLRDATAAEMKALAHPLRLRILRLVLDEALTNQQLAERVGRDPGTVLFHVRALERAGFIAADEPRPGRRGTTERPYRSTGKSWTLRMPPNVGHTTAVLQAVAEEVVEAGEDAVIASVRLGVRLRDDDVAELRRRLAAIGDEFAARDDPAGQPIGLLTLIHRRRI